MKPATFEYERVTSIDEAVRAAAEAGEGARYIAGGQSLIPMMNLRLARPTHLVDINPVQELAGVARSAAGLRVGAMTRHSGLERHADDLGGFEILRRAARLVGHYGIRDRGTVGGSIAHADPSAEWPLVAQLLGAQITVRGESGSRTVTMNDFLQGPFTTAIRDGELLTDILFPWEPEGSGLAEFAPRQGDFAIIAAAAAISVTDGTCTRARIAVAGVAGVPVRCTEAEAALTGTRLEPDAVEAAGRAAQQIVDPPDDPPFGAAFRRRLTGSLTTAAIRMAVTDVR